MSKAIPTIAVVAVCAILIGAGPVLAQDWPQWRGPTRDGKVAEFTVPETWPEQLSQEWKVTVGNGDSTPALVGERLYVFTRQGADEIILCLNAATGDEIWREEYAAQAVSGPARAHPGPRSSPAVAEGKVCTLGVGGILSCLDAAEGKLLWRKDAFPNQWPTYFTATSPLIVDGKCITHLGGDRGGAIIAYDLEGGDEKWRWSGDGPAYSSPTLMTVDGSELIVTMAAQSIVAISAADGSLAWQTSFSGGESSANAPSPVIDGQTVIYTGRGRGIRAVKIEKQDEGFVGNEVWYNPQIAAHYNTPVLRDGFLYGLSERGNLFCISAETGDTTWTDSTRYDTYGTMVDVGPVLLAVVLAKPNISQLVVLEPTEKEYTERARLNVSDRAAYAYPVASGNRLFVRDDENVILWTVE
jgi:outer membrane protein assembly factor BamB